MKLQSLVLSSIALAALAGCNKPAEPATPVAAPTEVAAVKTPPPQYPISTSSSKLRAERNAPRAYTMLAPRRLSPFLPGG